MLLNLLNEVVDGEDFIDGVEEDLDLLNAEGEGSVAVGLPLWQTE